ncbi:hypothetical protein H6F96_15505 [Microcoleus sp. FACHB-53]|nr:hypothetical protein [Microcoleus sp. FACHB-53]
MSLLKAELITRQENSETPRTGIQFGGLTCNIPLKILSKASERVRFSDSAIWVNLAIAVGVRDRLILSFNSSQKMGSPLRQAMPL